MPEEQHQAGVATRAAKDPVTKAASLEAGGLTSKSHNDEVAVKSVLKS